MADGLDRVDLSPEDFKELLRMNPIDPDIPGVYALMHSMYKAVTWKAQYQQELMMPSASDIAAFSHLRDDSLKLPPFSKPAAGRPSSGKRHPSCLEQCSGSSKKKKWCVRFASSLDTLQIRAAGPLGANPSWWLLFEYPGSGFSCCIALIALLALGCLRTSITIYLLALVG